MKRAIHPIKADMMRLHRMFPAQFGLTLMLACGLLFGVFLNNGATLLGFGYGVCGEDIGFFWNAIDPSAPDESLARSAFAGTSLFVPLIVCLVLLQEHGYKEGYRISSARGLARFNGALAHVLSSALIVGAAYSALCLLLFAIAILRGGAKLHARHADCIFACDDNQRRIGDIGCVGDDDHLSDYRQRCIERGCNHNWICHELDALRNLPSDAHTVLAMDLLSSGAVPWSRMCPWV